MKIDTKAFRGEAPTMNGMINLAVKYRVAVLSFHFPFTDDPFEVPDGGHIVVAVAQPAIDLSAWMAGYEAGTRSEVLREPTKQSRERLELGMDDELASLFDWMDVTATVVQTMTTTIGNNVPMAFLAVRGKYRAEHLRDFVQKYHETGFFPPYMKEGSE